MTIARCSACGIIALALGAACSEKATGPGAATAGTGSEATGGGSPSEGGSETGGGGVIGGASPATGGKSTSSTGGTVSSGGKAGSSGGKAGSSGGAPAATGGSISTGGVGAPNTNPANCGIDSPAFCETFEVESPGGRGGPLDENLWSFARYAHWFGDFFVRVPASTQAVDPQMFMPMASAYPPKFCGADFTGLLPGNDIAFCDGLDGAGANSKQMNEVYDDAGDFALNSMRVRQPFDFAGRTGTVAFDVDAKINPKNLGHGWWIEFWITEDPAPMPYHESPGIASFPRNGVGFAFQGTDCNKANWENSLTALIVTKNYKVLHDYSASDYGGAVCFKTQDEKLNRFKILISQTRAEVWVSDFDKPGTLRKIASVDKLDLPFTRGYVHLQHSAYNAHKDGIATPAQTYRWDNVAFDGPLFPTPRGYDVADSLVTPGSQWPNSVKLGYPATASQTASVKVSGVDLTSATRATLNIDIMAEAGRTLQYRFNAGAWHDYVLPAGDATYSGDYRMRAYTVEAPLAELKAGDNTIDFKMGTGDKGTAVMLGNMDLTVEIP